MEKAVNVSLDIRISGKKNSLLFIFMLLEKNVLYSFISFGA